VGLINPPDEEMEERIRTVDSNREENEIIFTFILLLCI
jgi:hypothetical protein